MPEPGIASRHTEAVEWGSMGRSFKKSDANFPKGGESMGVLIPDEVLQATRMTAEKLRQEIAILLFQKEKLTLR
jgi:hypothetical protein